MTVDHVSNSFATISLLTIAQKKYYPALAE